MKSQTILLLLFCSTLAAQKYRADDPLEFDLKPVSLQEAASRKLSDYYDAVTHTLATPGELNRDRKQPIPARGVNTLGEPLQGAWWVKRHYYSPMSISELTTGPTADHAPSMKGHWTVVGAKQEGITPGFVMLDDKQELYFVKFDPRSNPEMATGADHIAMRLVYALGYHVPDNYLVEFPSDLLTIGKDVKLADRLGRRRSMTAGDLAEMLQRVPKTSSGLYRATASRAIPGKAIGPYRYFGRRTDDPNDLVPHEHRRDLRGLAIISAWIDHDDSRAINTYDALASQDGRNFITHYILDLGSALGSGTQRPNSPRSGGEYLFGWKQSAVQLVSVGLAVPPWAKASFPVLPSVGLFEYERFNPATWVPEYPNPAFLNRLPDDEFWAAKQIMALRDQEIRAIVQTARYSDPRAERWLADCLIQRRDKIGRTYYRKVLPLDKFTIHDSRLEFKDLAAIAGFDSPAPYAVQWLSLDNATGATTPIQGATTFSLPSHGGPLRQAKITSAARPGQSVEITLRFNANAKPELVGIDRRW